MAAIGNPYATPGADFDPQSKMKAESIFGSPMQRQGLMNLGTPLHDKGHANDYEGHTHRKKEDHTKQVTIWPKLTRKSCIHLNFILKMVDPKLKETDKVNIWFQ